MSWEDSEPVRHRCPCGKGSYIVVDRSDDWGRFEERWSMECSACDAAYALYSCTFSRKGITGIYYGWAKKSALAALSEMHRRVGAEEGRLQSYLRKQYGRQWQNYFEGKSKKAIWAALTDNGQEYPSLPTFYDHVRHSSLHKVLGRYLDNRHLNTLTRLLHLRDTELQARRKRLEDLRKAAAKQDETVRAILFT